MPIETLAPAKVNLALHVTGRRADGYHLLDSVVVFAGIGDRVRARPADGLRLRIDGPEGAALQPDASNLVLRAARLMDPAGRADLELHKRLPVASGIGGGSADAAATLRVLGALWNRPLPPVDVILKLGADIPVCLAGQPARMRGIGEDILPLPPLPENAALVLVNPRVPVATPAVFGGLARRDNAPLDPLPGRFPDVRSLAIWLGAQRNDLQDAACALCPAITQVLAALQSTDCLLARMSGSGATCFGLYETQAHAQAAAVSLRRSAPEWWIQAAPVLREQPPVERDLNHR
ncbi:4-(cytidine 5'-diphospho)-2-C-methyl-D-erythritol kinase [Albidovulum inexpectatum]|nr:4-(cytidine 5'-diphospho)-2-C-methyl-D-erythritol kinase [Albidovulum inexpectatum]